MAVSDEVKQRLKSGGFLARYLEETGRGAVVAGVEAQIKCPDGTKHKNGDVHPSARYYSDGEGEHIHCHGCGGHWDLFALVMCDKGLDFPGALAWCAEHWGFPGGASRPAVVQDRTAPAKYVEECAARYGETDYLRRRGISDDVARRFKVGYDPAERRVVFPQGGGYSARAVDESAPMRYKYPKGVTVSPFNLGALWNVEGKPVFVVEGQIDALSVVEVGGLAVGLGGITHQKALLDAIRARPVSVPVCVSFDSDGREDTAKKARQLEDALHGLNVRTFTAKLYPPGCKDANDALRMDRASFGRAVAAAVQSVRASVVAARFTLWDVQEPPKEEENRRALLRGGYLRKGHGLVLVSTSGAGKSVLSMQLALSWAIGRGLWGMVPVRPLKVGIVQAEDDEEELAYFRRNMRGGLINGYGWTEEEFERACRGVTFEPVIGLTGDRFCDRLAAIQQEMEYDIIIVNPLFSFFGGNLADNADVSRFFRENVDPLIKDREKGFGVVFVHHATKPPKGNDRKGWGVDEFAQYIGAGGADLAGWARAELVLMPVSGHIGFYRLVAAKRSRPLGWKTADGAASNVRIIAHGVDYVYWRDPKEEEIPEELKTEMARAASGADISEDAARKKILDYLRTHGATKQTDLFKWCCNAFVGMKSSETKPCKNAYNDVVNHPERYGIETAKGAHGAMYLSYKGESLPGLDGGPSGATNATEDETDDIDGEGEAWVTL